jgi:hypothetical protein
MLLAPVLLVASFAPALLADVKSLLSIEESSKGSTDLLDARGGPTVVIPGEARDLFS